MKAEFRNLRLEPGPRGATSRFVLAPVDMTPPDLLPHS